MADSDQAAAKALAIMQEWQWLHCDPDGGPFPPGMALNEAVNRLAMEGLNRPQDAILLLLCQDDLIARGDLRWRKFDGLHHFQLDDGAAIVKPRYWQALADAIAVDHARKNAGNFGSETVNLTALGLSNCAKFEWDFAYSRFSVASGSDDPDDVLWRSPEEWFSIIEIDVWPRDKGQEMPDAHLIPATPATDKGGRPAAANWEVAALELAGRYYRGDFKPKTKADVKRELTAYLAEQDLHLADSTIGNHAKLIFEAFAAWEQE